MKNEYEDVYRNYLTCLTARELVSEYVHNIWFPWRSLEREWILRELEMRCVN